ncbi:MAG TPA: hypothetical protein VGL97_21325 [Bryobacteraceae bacterium]|jgi:predicted transcriptional regulator
MARVELDPFVSTEPDVEVSDEILARIDEGIQEADEGKLIRAEEVRRLIPQWISKSSTRQER